MKLGSRGTRVSLVGLGAVLAIGCGGIGVANAAGVNTGNAGAVSDVSGDGGVSFAGGCNYALAAVGINTTKSPTRPKVTPLQTGHWHPRHFVARIT